MNSNNIKVSVIIPVYNPGLGINKCIDSLLNQSLKDLEFIFVDDCGNDDSIIQIEKASVNDPRIKLIHNDRNVGPGESRNNGINAVSGEYLSFVDPDDYLALDFYEKLYKESNNGVVDIIKGKVLYVDIENRLIEKEKPLNNDIEKGLIDHKPLYYLYSYEHHGSLFKAKKIKEYGIKYADSSKAQDKYFLLQACHKLNDIKIVNDAYYYFCERLDSIMHTFNLDKLNGLYRTLYYLTDYINKNLYDDPYARAYLLTIIKYDINAFLHYDVDKEVFDEFLNNYCKQIMDISFCEELKQSSFSIYALLKYRVVLPTNVFNLPWQKKQLSQYISIIDQWLTFKDKHPQHLKDIKKDLCSLFVSAFLFKGNNHLKADKLIKQFISLPLSFKFCIALRLIKSKLFKHSTSNE